MLTMFKCRKKFSSASSTSSREASPVGVYRPRGLSTATAPMYSQQREVFSRGDHVQDTHKQWAALGAWFMGSKAENGEVFRDLLTQAIDTHIGFRRR